MTKKCEKLCVFCTHFSLSTGYADTFNSESGDMGCDENHFETYVGWNAANADSLRGIIFLAQTCKDYNQVKV